MEALISLLREKQLTISSIESLTAGLFASKLAEVPNASAVFKGSLVTYQTSCKVDVLGIKQGLIDQYGVVSNECAEAMVIQGEKMFHTDIVVSCTGNAGPSVLDNKEVGCVFMAIWYKQHIETYTYIFSGNRNMIREQVCNYLEKELLLILQGNK